MSQKKNQAIPIYTSMSSKFIFSTPISLFIFAIIYTLVQGASTVALFIFIFSGLSLLGVSLIYLKNKLIITKNKIYIFQGKQKIVAWSFIEDFYCVDYKQSALGKLFNYGTLYISNHDNKFYLFKMIDNPIQAYDNIIIQYEKIQEALDPSYKPRYNKDTRKIKNNIIIKDGKAVEIDRI